MGLHHKVVTNNMLFLLIVSFDMLSKKFLFVIGLAMLFSTKVFDLPRFSRTISTNEGLCERTEYIDIFLFSAHHSIMFCLLVEGECQTLVF